MKQLDPDMVSPIAPIGGWRIPFDLNEPIAFELSSALIPDSNENLPFFADVASHLAKAIERELRQTQKDRRKA